MKLQIDQRTVMLYTNSINISVTPNEFFLDVAIFQGSEVTHVDARIISSPPHTKRLAQMLAEAVRQYEAAHGPISAEVPQPGAVVYEHKGN